MKRGVLYILFMLFALSCDKSVDVVEPYVDIDISTSIEEGTSRVTSLSDIDSDRYNMRYTIELWSGNPEETVYSFSEVIAITDSWQHSFRAVAGDYRLVIFADYIDMQDGEKSHYDTSEGLDAITISETTYTANDLSRDCYGYSEDIEVNASFSLSGIALKRQMAKITLANNAAPSTLAAGTDISIIYGNSIPNGYDLVNGAAITDETISVSYPSTSAYGQEILAYDYIFISAPTNYLMTFKVGEKEVGATVNFEQNKTTNITANFNETE